MALNYNAAGLSFFERILLFITQLFRSYEPMQAVPSVSDSEVVIAKETNFRHGSAEATLTVTAILKVGAPEKPAVTYLDKYVTGILNSGVFTMTMNSIRNGLSLPLAVYEDENNTALDVSFSSRLLQTLNLTQRLSSLGSVRLIINDKNAADANVYLAWPNGYYEIEDPDIKSELIANQSTFLNDFSAGLEYVGVFNSSDTVCEMYKDVEQDLLYSFYFADTTDDYEGLVRVDVSDLKTGLPKMAIALRLYAAVTDDRAFTVSGQKFSFEELKALIG